MNDIQRGLITTTHGMDPSLAGQQLKERIAELVPPSVRFSKNIEECHLIHTELRNFLKNIDVA